MVKALLLDKKSQNQSHAPVKAVEKSCVTCGGAHSYRNCPATDGNVYRDNIQEFVSQASVVNYNQGNASYPYQASALQTQGVSKEDFLAYVKDNDAVMRNMQTQGQNMQNQLTNMTELITKFVNSNSASTLSSGTLPSNTIANPRSDFKAITTRSGVSNDGPQIPPPPFFLHKVVENKPEATKDTVNTTNNESTKDVQPQIFKDMSFEISFEYALILMPKFASTLKALIGNKEKLRDPGKFLIPCHFPGIAECLALANLGASINLMSFSVWKRLSLPDLTPTCMTLELDDRSISHPVGVAEDVYVKVGSFHFLADFIVVDFDADPRVSLILGRSFLKTRIALIDVFEGELTLRVGKEAITLNLDQTLRYSANYNDMTAKQIDLIDMACEEYSQEVLEVFLNDDPSLPPPNQGNYLPEVHKKLKICEAKSDKSLIDEPFEVEQKDLPPHLKYAFLEGDDKLPVIIAKYLILEEKTALITVLKSHKRAITWKPSDIKGIDPEVFTHKILMEEDFEPTVQHQRRVIPKIYDVIKQEVMKLLDAVLIYPIADSPWVSPVHCVPKKGGFTVVENEDNELILTRLVMGWRVCIDYHKLNEATHKDHFPLSFMDQMLERLEKTTFTCPYRTFAYRRMPFGLCNAPGTFQRCMMEIFHDMIEKTMAVFMDEFFVSENSFQSCFSHLERMLKRCEDTNLCLNWEKSHFLVKEECVEAFQTLKRKLTEAPILIALDWDMPIELMCDASDFAIGAVLGKRQDKHFRKIHYASKTMTEAESNYTTTEKEMFVVEFTFKVIDTKGAENLDTNHLSRLENPHQNVLDPKKINESFPLETLNLVSTRGKNCASWSDKLDDALWAFRTAYKTPTGCTPYKLVYGKACHLLIELEHKAYWALKHANFDLKTADDHRKVQINELNELRDSFSHLQGENKEAL
nr:DNA-directed DNA polymerase [Tanacetum cinerariifolium]